MIHRTRPVHNNAIAAHAQRNRLVILFHRIVLRNDGYSGGRAAHPARQRAPLGIRKRRRNCSDRPRYRERRARRCAETHHIRSAAAPCPYHHILARERACVVSLPRRNRPRPHLRQPLATRVNPRRHIHPRRPAALAQRTPAGRKIYPRNKPGIVPYPNSLYYAHPAPLGWYDALQAIAEQRQDGHLVKIAQRTRQSSRQAGMNYGPRLPRFGVVNVAFLLAIQIKPCEIRQPAQIRGNRSGQPIVRKRQMREIGKLPQLRRNLPGQAAVR